MADIADSMGLILAAKSNMGPDVDALEMSSLKESRFWVLSLSTT